jgi:hypothetical protein
MNSAASNSLRKLRLPAYLAAAFLFAYPVIDTFIPALPVHAGLPQWRYALTLAMAGTIVNPLLAMLILLGVAIASDDRIGTIVVSSLSVVSTLVLLGTTVTFTLDAIQLHGVVNPVVTSRYTGMSIWILVRIALAMVTMGIISVVAIGTLRRQATTAAQSNGRNSMLVGTRRPGVEPELTAPDARTARMSAP